MDNVINLRLKRKAKARDEAAAKAAENRTTFGRAKAEKKLTILLNTKAEKALDGHKCKE